MEILRTWYEMALQPQYWRPVSGSHKPDQAVLSVLIYRAAAAAKLTVNAGEIDVSCGRPVRWMSSRNKVAPWVPTFADPAVRAWYRVGKAVDRIAIRARETKRTTVDGWHRWPKEHYTVWIRALGREPRWTQITAPTGSYYADPFLWCEGDRRFLFVEQFRYRENAGRVVALALDAELRVTGASPLTIGAGHRSFPFLFKHEDALYLVPESSTLGTVDLYRCEELPHRWRLLRRLRSDIDAADSTLHFHDGLWWLFTSVRCQPPRPGRALAVYFTTDLATGQWHPHPVNAESRYAERRFGYGRNAGNWLRSTSGVLVRPIHASERHYGERVELMAIDALTPQVFSESPLRREDPLRSVVPLTIAHHLSTDGNVVAFDRRDRIGYWSTLVGRPRRDWEVIQRPAK